MGNLQVPKGSCQPESHMSLEFSAVIFAELLCLGLQISPRPRRLPLCLCKHRPGRPRRWVADRAREPRWW